MIFQGCNSSGAFKMSDSGLDESGPKSTDQDFVDSKRNIELLVVMEVSKLQTSPFSLLKLTLWVCLTFAVGSFQHIWEAEAFTLNFFLSKEILICLHYISSVNSVSRPQQVCPILGSSDNRGFFAFFISSSTHEAHTDLHLLLSLKNIAIPLVLPDPTH